MTIKKNLVKSIARDDHFEVMGLEKGNLEVFKSVFFSFIFFFGEPKFAQGCYFMYIDGL